ncbi:hypothetical protein EM6_1352 [Asticcacaulis excentricus]|uniref:Uncharacterized protein n=1 Tax=Asticcacaulis excentricus TaxID=78587 RepID=A0A3G9G244_9CAUL|nr:hypothetical protein EM6_1352 [Asticcacaulis excentricus]
MPLCAPQPSFRSNDFTGITTQRLPPLIPLLPVATRRNRHFSPGMVSSQT